MLPAAHVTRNHQRECRTRREAYASGMVPTSPPMEDLLHKYKRGSMNGDGD